jgi:deoxycytidylate deaminase
MHVSCFLVRYGACTKLLYRETQLAAAAMAAQSRMLAAEQHALVAMLTHSRLIEYRRTHTVISYSWTSHCHMCVRCLAVYVEYVLDIVLQHQHYVQHPLEHTSVRSVNTPQQ